MLGVGGALGLPLAGFVAEHADFHALFWITAVAGLAAFLGILLDRPRGAGPQRRPGRPGRAPPCSRPALVTPAAAVDAEREVGLGRPAGLAVLLAVSAVLIVVFGWTPDCGSRTRWSTSRPCAAGRSCITNLASILFGFALFASFIGTAAYVEAPAASGYGSARACWSAVS